MRIKCPDCQLTLKRRDRTYVCPGCSLEVQIEADVMGDLKERLRSLKDGLGHLSTAELKRVIKDRNHPATMMLIGFLAWGITYFLRFPIFFAIVLALGFLMGPWGLVIMVVLPLVYSAHKQAIEAEVDRMTGQKDSDSSPEFRG